MTTRGRFASAALGRRGLDTARAGRSARPAPLPPGIGRGGRGRPSVPWALLTLIALGLSGKTCNPGAAPQERALYYLERQQLERGLEHAAAGRQVVDWAGNWPQYFYLEGRPALRFRDVSPFVATFIHDALGAVPPGAGGELGLPPARLEAIEQMRARARAFMRTFAAEPGAPDAGTFGFWPVSERLGQPETPVDRLFLAWLGGPVLHGTRGPINVHRYPVRMAIPPDADVTAAVYAALLDEPGLDLLAHGPAIARLFEEWRDTGAVPRRFNPPWLPPASGAFLTWLHYGSPPGMVIHNDVDLVVNANVLYALARYGQLNTPGVEEAVNLIRFVVDNGLHRTHFEEISLYYPDNHAFQYCVARAFQLGPVLALQTVAERLADELEADVRWNGDGGAYWATDTPVLSAAFAALTLLYTGRGGPVLDGAIRYITASQCLIEGRWPEEVFFVAKTDAGPQFNWVSPSLTTAICFEAIVRYELSQTGAPHPAVSAR